MSPDSRTRVYLCHAVQPMNTMNLSAALDTQAPPHPAYARLKHFFEHFSAETLEALESIYTPDVEFRDPIHTVHGAFALRHYLRTMASNLTHYRLRYLEEQVGANAAFVSWEMDYAHPRLAGGKILTIRGISHLKYTDKVYFHEDCYDVGALLYEHLPLLGPVTRFLKHRMS